MLQQVPCVIAVALFGQQEGGLFQGCEVAGLPIALFPFCGGARLRGRLRGAIQALLEHGIGPRVGAGGAGLELFPGQVRVLM
ncbi:hypothetical protein D3C75_1125110 [compost metagenome]